MQLDLRDLKFFLAVAEASSLSKAAAKVHRTQPALTKCIQRLEEAVGAPLFERSGKGVRLTAIGQALRERVTYLANTLDETVRDIGNLARGLTGQAGIGAIPVVVEYLFPGLCRELVSPERSISLRIFPDTTGNLFRMLRDNTLDLIVVPLEPLDEDLECRFVMEDRVVVVANPEHEIFSVPNPDVNDLASCGWLLPSQAVGPRVWLERFFADRGLPRPRIPIEVPCVRLMPSIIAEANLLSFVADRRLHPGSFEHSLLRMVPVEEAVMRRRFSVAWMKHRPLSPVARRVVELLTERGHDFYYAER